MNLPLVTSFIAIFFTQVIKYPIAYFTKSKNVSIDLVTSTGGMPSSHSAAVSSLITALILEYGFSSPYVAIATVFGVIVMFDSMGVRRQSGEQGIVLDIIARHLIANESIHKEAKADASNPSAHPLAKDYSLEDYEKMIVNKYLGHKPTEVIVGVITGSVVAVVVRSAVTLFME
ncbi:divergent PAP2 family protein [Fundicoccus culcitae]|uniref:Divergent PAP2 family protein n=1 Tax=Fundicoccus culcitae TaxID=2969821 RepID=A0ABY5PAC4_9LACT|nr:divergent PAP2 family protein [Fundicoccus culcitae]UUX35433.1 divergent PAP2 family protein [Fundicoccus culcitae]